MPHEISLTSSTSFENLQLINEAEVIFEDGLSINDVIMAVNTNEDIIFNPTNIVNIDGNNLVASTIDNNDEDSTEPTPYTINEVNMDSQIIAGTDDEDSTNSTQYTTNKTDKDTQIIEGTDDEEDPDDPDFVWSSEDDTMNDTGIENSSTNINSEIGSVNNRNLNEIANNSQDNICAIEALNDEGNINQKRHKRPKELLWDVNVHKRLRMIGKRYVGYKRVKVGDKVLVQRSEKEHEERKIGPMCNSKVCQANVKRKCTEITEDIRKRIFNKFWPMTWKEKQIYICDHVQKCEIQQKTIKDNSKKSRRSASYKYCLSPANGELKPVCKIMFLNTLGLKEWMVRNWVENDEPVSESGKLVDQNVSEVEDGNDLPQLTITGSKRNKEKQVSEKKKVVSEWLDTLAVVPSHYCRKSSSKMYLEPLWDSKADLYRSFNEYCINNEKPAGTLTTFMEVFDEKNLSIFVPKKDQCDTCYAFRAGNISEQEYNNHIKEKDSARREKDMDKEKALKGEIHCLSADVESVKLTPMTKASAMYYKTKLCSHNYSVYNLANRHCKCYWFTEVDGDLSANSFASCLLDYLKEHCLTPRLPIVVYTDGCTNQNRNQFVSNALLHFAVQNDIEVTQKYLIKGHTQMEGDSVHARIESKIKGKDIYLPYEYVRYTKEARQNPFPYDAIDLKHDFFKDFSNINYYDSVRPGRKKGDPCVVDVHCFRYTSNGKIQYKLSFSEDFRDLPRRPNKVAKDLLPSQLFKSRIPIQYTKWKHLQDLKCVIPQDFHYFYDSLPYKK